jgi:hypothetical protein
VLLDSNTPCCFTSMSEEESRLDAHALRAAGAAVVLPQRNAFGSLVPIQDCDAAPDAFFYTNMFVACFKGRRAGRGPGGAGGSSNGGAGAAAAATS